MLGLTSAFVSMVVELLSKNWVGLEAILLAHGDELAGAVVGHQRLVKVGCLVFRRLLKISQSLLHMIPIVEHLGLARVYIS